MTQVVAWFVAGSAWGLIALVTDDLRRGARSPKHTRLFVLSSGVAVAATAVALGVGR